MTPDIARILDANINRAREALRVMEDYARFVLNDAVGCEALKDIRHGLADIVRQLPQDALLQARNTPGDVGTTISTGAERKRAGARDVFIAAAKRLPEALRTIEEYAKIFSPDLGAAAERLRYHAYDVEQQLTLRGDRRARFARTRLYVLISASLCKRDWLETADLAIDGGADCLQLREKSLEDGELLARARAMSALCRRRNALFIVNDRPDIAVLADADGVHLGQTDMSPADARRILGPDRLIGLSTHNPDQLRAALSGKAAAEGSMAIDYLAVGPMFASSTKPQDHVPGPDLLAMATRATSLPIVPIGGIAAGNLDMLLAAGAQRVCVCSAVISADDPTAAASDLASRLEGRL
jgi:thiamine-phosphate pyrophosphorylase